MKLGLTVGYIAGFDWLILVDKVRLAKLLDVVCIARDGFVVGCLCVACRQASSGLKMLSNCLRC